MAENRTTYKWIGMHTQDIDGSGIMLAPGERVKLTDEQMNLPFNKALMDEGLLIKVEKEGGDK